jgi:hypothetical protein
MPDNANVTLTTHATSTTARAAAWERMLWLAQLSGTHLPTHDLDSEATSVAYSTTTTGADDA